MLVNQTGGCLDDFYSMVVIQALIKILKDPSLHEHHMVTVQAITFNFTFLGMRCVPFIPQVLPTLIHVIRNCESINREVNLSYESLTFHSLDLTFSNLEIL